MAGGQPTGKLIAMNKFTGEVIWRALSSETDLGAAQPVIITAGGARQLIAWYPGAVASLNPESGHTTSGQTRNPTTLAGFHGSNEVMFRHGIDLLGAEAPTLIKCSSAQERSSIGPVST